VSLGGVENGVGIRVVCAIKSDLQLYLALNITLARLRKPLLIAEEFTLPPLFDAFRNLSMFLPSNISPS